LTKSDNCVIVVCMLVRKQILLEEKQALELEELALLAGVSMSQMVRESISSGLNIQKMKIRKIAKKQKSQYDGWDKWIAGAVEGPNDSEYDKYAYDL